MTVREYAEDIFDSPAQSLVCPVNIYGAMGKGLAEEFRYKVPGLYERYRRLCFSKRFGIHQLWPYPWQGTDKQVICFPTKTHWKVPSSEYNVVTNLHRLVELEDELKITSLAIPPVGCGQGGLEYDNLIRKQMFEILGKMRCEVRIVLGRHANV